MLQSLTKVVIVEKLVRLILFISLVLLLISFASPVNNIIKVIDFIYLFIFMYVTKIGLLKTAVGCLYAFVTTIYYSLPAVCSNFLDKDSPGKNFASGMGVEFEFLASYDEGINKLLVYICILSGAISLLFIAKIFNTKYRLNARKYFRSKISGSEKFVLSLIILLTVYSTIQYVIKYLGAFSGGSADYTLFNYIFFDHALYMLLIYLGVNYAAPREEMRIILFSYGAVLVIFIASGSKAAILFYVIFMFIFPLCYARSNDRLIWPSPYLILFFIPASLIVFYIVLLLRMLIGAGISVEDLDLITTFSSSSEFRRISLFETIVERLGQSGFLRMSLIVQYVLNENVLLADLIEYFRLIIFSTVNLIVPGTIFPSYFNTSSMVLWDVLLQTDLDTKAISRDEYIRALNTQTTTFHGFFMLFYGFLGILISNIVLCIISLVVELSDGIGRLVLIYFSYFFLVPYGVDVVLANTVHVLISLSIMMVPFVLLRGNVK